MKYYRGHEPEEWPVWVEFLAGLIAGTTGILSFPFMPLCYFGLASIKIALVISAISGIAFGFWLIRIRNKEG